MAKKVSPGKKPKSAGEKAKSPPKRQPAPVENNSLSVTDGAMKNVFRAAFLRRDD